MNLLVQIVVQISHDRNDGSHKFRGEHELLELLVNWQLAVLLMIFGQSEQLKEGYVEHKCLENDPKAVNHLLNDLTVSYQSHYSQNTVIDSELEVQACL